MASALTYSKCTLAQLELLSSMSRETFRQAFEAQNEPQDFKTYLDKAFSLETLGRELAQTATSFYFIYREDALVAYMKLNTGNAQTDLREASGMELERIYVLKDYQGLGIGAEVLSHVKQMAREAGKEYLWLGVWEENKDAIRFYEKHGFVKSGMHPYYIGNDRQMDWVMKTDLRNLNPQ
ncbi:GNAT family N-acetyltransferase [Zeaxanthinibacter sp. PT1]|uniref:GNAT family N-acetyltransferase n=1 Tax=Zeaxanthinibacter TaxID=561554 RepID=UPI00234A9F37|nr:GNAT family N-acetyltransferase [Zeaxanthinibacter sp. PT1]MDC6350550.1 GNAT family N-acetyltransferase [Zeaxanthinibacter sp. PT1]